MLTGCQLRFSTKAGCSKTCTATGLASTYQDAVRCSQSRETLDRANPFHQAIKSLTRFATQKRLAIQGLRRESNPTPRLSQSRMPTITPRTPLIRQTAPDLGRPGAVCAESDAVHGVLVRLSLLYSQARCMRQDELPQRKQRSAVGITPAATADKANRSIRICQDQVAASPENGGGLNGNDREDA